MRLRAFAGALLLVLCACAREGTPAVSDGAPAESDTPSAGGAASVATLDSLDRTVAGIRQGTIDTLVRAIAGAPDSVSEVRLDEMIGDSVQTWYYAGLTVDFVEHRADGIACRRPGCATGKSVRVGDPAASVSAAYGPGTPHSGDDGEAVVYRDENNCGMSFDLAAGRVSAIRVFCDHS